MCFTLACGLPYDLAPQLSPTILGYVLNDEVFGGKATYEQFESKSQTVQYQQESNATLSHKFEGLAITVSRLLRPVWFTPLVVLRGNWDYSSSREAQQHVRRNETPKKKAARAPSVSDDPPLLLSQGELEELIMPMRSLITFVRSLWKREEVVKALHDTGDFYAPGPNDPKSPQQAAAAAADIVANGGNLQQGYFAGLDSSKVIIGHRNISRQNFEFRHTETSARIHQNY